MINRIIQPIEKNPLMEHENFDVVIVGAGISGALVANELSKAGKKVLILEAGIENGLSSETYRDYLNIFYQNPIKVPNSPYPNNNLAPQSNVLQINKISPGFPDPSGYFVQKGPLPFSSTNTRSTGGTTLHWLGICLRMLPNDFKLESVYGRGVDWPQDYWDLKPYYEAAELEIGVSADRKDLKYPGTDKKYFGNYEFPMHKIPPTYLDKILSQRLKGMTFKDGKEEVEIDVVSIPQGRNSIPNKNYRDPKTKKKLDYIPVGAVDMPYSGDRCEGNSNCIPICPVQAKYNALKTLSKATAKQNAFPVKIQTQSVVSRLNIDSQSGKITGVVYKRYTKAGDPNSVTEGVAYGTRYVLATSAIENAKIMLSSGVKNSSGQLGCNLMDHPYLLTWALMPDNVGPFRGPFSSSGIPSFRDGQFRNRHAAFRTDIGNWGWNFPTGAPFTDVETMVDNENLFGYQLRKKLYDTVQKQFRFGFLIEQSPQKSNRVTIDDAYRDAIGNYRPVIQYDLTDYEKAGFAAAKAFSDQVFQRLGAGQFTVYNSTDAGYVKYQDNGYTFHGSGHIVGTHRMGHNPKDSVVSIKQRCWDHSNLFLIGCGSMPTIGTSNPTLTMAALAMQAAEEIIKDLR